MPLNSDSTPTLTFTHHCFKVSRVIQWLTVALVSGLLASEEGMPAALAAALSAVIVIHLFAVIRDRTRRRDELRHGVHIRVG
jgi:hypothetical protein